MPSVVAEGIKMFIVMRCKRCRLNISEIIKAMNYVLLTISGILFAALVIVFVHTLIFWEYHPSLTRDGVISMQAFWYDYRYVIQAFAGCFTLFVVSYNLQKYIDIETVKALGDLREKLNSKDKQELHAYLLHEDDKKPILEDFDKKSEVNPQIVHSNIVLLDYIGTIELGAIMLKRRVITYEEFNNQFGYRLENLMNNRSVREHIENNSKYYTELRYIISKYYSDWNMSGCDL